MDIDLLSVLVPLQLGVHLRLPVTAVVQQPQDAIFDAQLVSRFEWLRRRPTDAVANCDDCHTLDSMSAHRSPALFARMIVIPWAKAHSYTDLPKRKEYLAL